MEKEIIIFNHPQFGDIRCMKDENGEPWFVGKDVAEKLGYSNTRDAINKHIDSDDKTTVAICDTGSNYKTQVVVINESGLYSLILSSKLPQAREFKHWVTATVLPQIRKTGGYIPFNEDEDENSLLARALMIAQNTIDLKNSMLEEQRPKVLFADAVSKSEDSILVRDLAKLITQAGVEIGAGRLFYWLRRNKYLFKDNSCPPRPRQEWVERGLFEVCVRTYQVGKHIFEHLTTRVTGKGQQYFVNGFITGKFRTEAPQ